MKDSKLKFLNKYHTFPFLIFIYLQETILDAWLKKKLHTTQKHFIF